MTWRTSSDQRTFHRRWTATVPLTALVASLLVVAEVPQDAAADTPGGIGSMPSVPVVPADAMDTPASDDSTADALGPGQAPGSEVSDGGGSADGDPAVAVGHLGRVGADRRLHVVLPAAGAAGAGRPPARASRWPTRRRRSTGARARRTTSPPGSATAGSSGRLRRAHVRRVHRGQGRQPGAQKGFDNAATCAGAATTRPPSYDGGGGMLIRYDAATAGGPRTTTAPGSSGYRSPATATRRRRALEDHHHRRHPVLLRLAAPDVAARRGPCRSTATTRTSPATTRHRSRPRAAPRRGGGTSTRSWTATATRCSTTTRKETNRYGDFNDADKSDHLRPRRHAEPDPVRPAHDGVEPAAAAVEFATANRCIPGSLGCGVQHQQAPATGRTPR